MRDLPEVEYRRMTEYAIRAGEQDDKARKAASMGSQPPRRGKPVIESTKAATKDFDGF